MSLKCFHSVVVLKHTHKKPERDKNHHDFTVQWRITRFSQYFKKYFCCSLKIQADVKPWTNLS